MTDKASSMTGDATEGAQARKEPTALQGVVRSSKMDKSVVVTVTSRVMHGTYKKYVTRRESFMAHDERNEYRPGDVVKIVACRPLSQRKRWRVVELVQRPD